jgi:hypothetical protein
VKLFALLMLPANMLCDRLELADENERGVVRMLVNALLWTTVGVFVVWIF